MSWPANRAKSVAPRGDSRLRRRCARTRSRPGTVTRRRPRAPAAPSIPPPDFFLAAAVVGRTRDEGIGRGRISLPGPGSAATNVAFRHVMTAQRHGVSADLSGLLAGPESPEGGPGACRTPGPVASCPGHRIEAEPDEDRGEGTDRGEVQPVAGHREQWKAEDDQQHAEIEPVSWPHDDRRQHGHQTDQETAD